MHVDRELLITDVPREAIMECSAPGQVDEDVTYWREQLNLTVNRERAIECLAGYGAWERDDLNGRTDDDLAEIVLWLACGNFAEYITECEADGLDPFDGEYHESNCGSDTFVLD